MKKRFLAAALSIILSASLFLTDAAPALAQGLAGSQGVESDIAGETEQEEAKAGEMGSEVLPEETEEKEDSGDTEEKEASEDMSGEADAKEDSEDPTEQTETSEDSEESTEDIEESSEENENSEDSEEAENGEDIEETEDLEETEDSKEEDLEEELFDLEGSFTEEQLKKQEEAREELQKILEDNLVLALIYLTEEYDLKDELEEEGKVLASLPSGTTVEIKNIALDSYNRIWYQVNYYTEESVMTGYVLRDYLVTASLAFLDWEEEYLPAFQVVSFRTFAATTTDDAEINAFPYGYRSALIELKKKHPNWHFVPYKTGVTLDSAVAEEYKNNRCLVPKSSSLRDNDTEIEPGWCQASKDAISYYLNPQNFLTDEKIFQFESLNYNADNAKLNIIEEIVKGTFMDALVPDGGGYRYANFILQAGVESKVNPYHLAARLKQEQGTNGTSPLISGNYSGYEGYYNFFNIGASGSTKALIYQNGLEYAKKQGWNSRFSSIIGGSKILGSRYVLIGQDTLYLQKFDFVDTYYTHQYMQNLLAPYNEAASMRKAYVSADSLNNAFVFKIPVFLESIKMSVEKKEMDYNSDNKIIMKIGDNVIPAKSCQYTSSNEAALTIDEEGKIRSYEKCGVITVKATYDFDAGIKNLEEIKKKFDTELAEKETELGEKEQELEKIENGSGENEENPNEAQINSIKEDIEKINEKITRIKENITEVTGEINELKSLKTAYKDYNKKTVTVTIKVCGMEIINETDVIRKNTYRQLNLDYVLPQKLSASKIEYSSSAPEIISIDAKGTMNAHKVGKAEIKVNCGENYKDSLIFYVCPDGFEWEEEMISLKPEETEVISLKWNEEDIEGKDEWSDQIKEASKVKFASSDDTIARVSEDGVITAVSCGKTKIKALMGCGFMKEREVSVAARVTLVNEKANEEEQILYAGYQSFLESIPDGTAVKDYHFAGWYTEKDGKGNRLETTTIFLSDQTYYAFYLEAKDDFLVLPIGDQIYTGKALKPDVRVCDGNRVLTLGKDYTLQYSMNTNVGTAIVKVKGKGNYSGQQETSFEIKAKNISDSDVFATAADTSYNKKKITTKPVLKYQGKTLAYEKDFIYLYVTENGTIIDPIDPGNYWIKVEGQGNYSGTRLVPIEVTKRQSVSKLSLSAVSNQAYDEGRAICPPMIIKDGKKVLEEGVDYSLQYKNNHEIGTASIVIKGEGNYYGERTKTFKINGIAKISSVKISGWTSVYDYDGNEHRQDPDRLVLSYKDELLKEGRDYRIDYLTDVTNVGKVTAIITGINAYYGTVKKTYNIRAFDISNDSLLETSLQKIKVDPVGAVPYMKGGSKPTGNAVKVSYKGELLSEGTDYSLSYGNNNAVTTELTPENKLPTITIKGKGNFKGVKKVTFKITTADIVEYKPFSMASDVVYKNKKNAYKPILNIVAPNGKRLSAGTDYEKTMICQPLEKIECEDGTILEAGKNIETDCIIPVGSHLKVIITGKNNYAGSTMELEYRIVEKSISSAKVKIENQVYTGREIIPKEMDMSVKITDSEILQMGRDYEIVSGSGKNNENIGTATIIIRGIGNYGGTKTVKFTIKNKTILPFRFFK